MNTELQVFLRQVRSRSREHQQAMQLLAGQRLVSQMVAVLRQELDSMVRVIFLLRQDLPRRDRLIAAAVQGERWTRESSRSAVTDREMVNIADQLTGWTKSVYKFGCAFIHLSNLHDYNDRDPLRALPLEEREDLLNHCRYYHGGPSVGSDTLDDLVPYLPAVLDKISGNLECYLKQLANQERPTPIEM